jgi:hypothetical protein
MTLILYSITVLRTLTVRCASKPGSPSPTGHMVVHGDGVGRVAWAGRVAGGRGAGAWVDGDRHKGKMIMR